MVNISQILAGMVTAIQSRLFPADSEIASALGSIELCCRCLYGRCGLFVRRYDRNLYNRRESDFVKRRCEHAGTLVDEGLE